MAFKTAKLFVNGGSQAVRLPAEFRFEGLEEVHIRRDNVTGDVILSTKTHRQRWTDFFELRDSVRPQVSNAFAVDKRFPNDTLRPAEKS
jgi:antitoxin VapB